MRVRHLRRNRRRLLVRLWLGSKDFEYFWGKTIHNGGIVDRSGLDGPLREVRTRPRKHD